MTQIQWTKPVCQLDSDGLYIGRAEAELDVYARDGSYLIPGGCIDTEPPEIPAGHAARWNGSGWEVIEDHRGKPAYRKDSGEIVFIDTVGALSDGLTITAPPSDCHEWDGEKWVENQAKAKARDDRLLSAAKNAVLSDISRRAQALVSEKSGMDGLPAFEVQSWPIQAAEARAWQADRSAETPVLNQIAQSRGIDADKLKAAALKKPLPTKPFAPLLPASVRQWKSKSKPPEPLKRSKPSTSNLKFKVA